MSKVHIASCACGWVGEAEGGTHIVNYFCPKCGTGKYLVSIGDYYPAAKVRALVEAIKKYQEMAILVFECKYADLAAVGERFELSCINLNAALAALESDNE